MVNKGTQAIFAIFMMQMTVVGRNLHIYSAGTTHGLQTAEHCSRTEFTLQGILHNIEADICRDTITNIVNSNVTKYNAIQLIVAPLRVT